WLCGGLEGQMVRFAWLGLLALIVLSPAPVIAGAAEDANAALDRWSAAYTGNDPDTVARTYWPDAVLLGTVSPIMSEGTEAIRTYFLPLKGSDNKNEITERRTFVLNDSAVVVAGFYLFTRKVDGKPVPAPSRFTMLLTKRGNGWAIAHHDTRAGLGLPQTNVGPVISRPREAQEIALPLAGPQRKQQRQMEMRWRALEKCRLVIGRPN